MKEQRARSLSKVLVFQPPKGTFPGLIRGRSGECKASAEAAAGNSSQWGGSECWAFIASITNILGMLYFVVVKAWDRKTSISDVLLYSVFSDMNFPSSLKLFYFFLILFYVICCGGFFFFFSSVHLWDPITRREFSLRQKSDSCSKWSLLPCKL